MPAGCVLRPEEISLLARVLETHCSKHGIRTPEGKESVARSVLTYFGHDMTEAALLEILDLEDNPLLPPSVNPFPVTDGAEPLLLKPGS